MKIKRFKGYKIVCPECCEIFFNKEDVSVRVLGESDNNSFLPINEWYKKPFNTILYRNLNGWIYTLDCDASVKCPICGSSITVWQQGIHLNVLDISDENCKKTIKELIEEGLITESRIGISKYNTEPYYEE